MPKFITLGNYTINVNAISYVDWKEGVTDNGEKIGIIYLYHQARPNGVPFYVDSIEGRELQEHLENSQTNLDS